MKDEIIEATVHGFDKYELHARDENENDIVIDPFVTDLFPWEEREKLIGTWLFKGHWYQDTKCFLPTKIMHPLQNERIEQLEKALEMAMPIVEHNSPTLAKMIRHDLGKEE